MAMQLWKRSNSVGRSLWTGRCIYSTTSGSVSIRGLPEDEVKAHFEAFSTKYGKSYKTVEEKEEMFRIWKMFKLTVEFPDPNDPLRFRPGPRLPPDAWEIFTGTSNRS